MAVSIRSRKATGSRAGPVDEARHVRVERGVVSARSGRPLSISAWPDGGAAQERIELAVGDRLEAGRLGWYVTSCGESRRDRVRRAARALPLRKSSWVQPVHAPICLPAGRSRP